MRLPSPGLLIFIVCISPYIHIWWPYYRYIICLSIKLGFRQMETRKEKCRHLLTVLLAFQTTSHQAAWKDTGLVLLPHETKEGWTSCTTLGTYGLSWQRWNQATLSARKEKAPLAGKMRYIPILSILVADQLGGHHLTSKGGVHDSWTQQEWWHHPCASWCF